MKRVLFAALLLTLFFAFNAGGADLKIGYVDFNKALNESDEGRKATARLEDVIEKKKSLLSEKDKEIKALDEELKKQSSVLSQDSRIEKEDRLKKLIREAQRMSEDFKEELKKKEADLTLEIQKDLMKVVDQIAKEDGYSVIFERGISGILYFEEKFDLTDRAIKKYNENKAKK